MSSNVAITEAKERSEGSLNVTVGVCGVASQTWIK